MCTLLKVSLPYSPLNPMSRNWDICLTLKSIKVYKIIHFGCVYASSLSHLDSPLGSSGATWFSLHINIIQLLDKYSSQGSSGSLQEQLQTQSCNAKHLSQPLPASSALLLSPPASSLPSSFCFLGECLWCFSTVKLLWLKMALFRLKFG